MGDVQLKQLLLNRLQDSQSNLVIKAIRQQVTGTRNRASGPDGEFIQRLAQTARVGKHWLELVFDEPAEGLRLEASNRSWSEALQARCTDRANHWWGAGAAVVLLFFLSQVSRGGRRTPHQWLARPLPSTPDSDGMTTERADYMRRSTGARYGPCVARAPRGLSLLGRPRQRRHCLRVIRADRIR